MDASSRKQLWMMMAIVAICAVGCRSTNVDRLRLSSAEAPPAQMAPHPSYAQTPPAKDSSTRSTDRASENFISTEQVSLELGDNNTTEYRPQQSTPESVAPYSTAAYPYQSSGRATIPGKNSTSCPSGCSH